MNEFMWIKPKHKTHEEIIESLKQYSDDRKFQMAVEYGYTWYVKFLLDNVHLEYEYEIVNMFPLNNTKYLNRIINTSDGLHRYIFICDVSNEMFEFLKLKKIKVYEQK